MTLRRHLLYGGPLLLAAAAGASFLTMLRRMNSGAFDPHDIGSPMTGKKIPDFALPAPGGGVGFSSRELLAQNRPVLINFFASWCVPCVGEMTTLAALASVVPIWGIAYQDKQADVARFLRRYGDPYLRLAADVDGDTAIDFGLYGVPETYLIDRMGVIRARIAGALSDGIVRTTLLPLLDGR